MGVYLLVTWGKWEVTLKFLWQLKYNILIFNRSNMIGASVDVFIFQTGHGIFGCCFLIVVIMIVC